MGTYFVRSAIATFLLIYVGVVPPVLGAGKAVKARQSESRLAGNVGSAMGPQVNCYGTLKECLLHGGDEVLCQKLNQCSEEIVRILREEMLSQRRN